MCTALQLTEPPGTLAQVFSCEFCEISKNTFFTEHLWTTASVTYTKKLYREDPENVRDEMEEKKIPAVSLDV